MSPKADLIITGARGLTCDPGNPTAQAVAIQGNRILYAGSPDTANEFRSSTTRVIDAQGKTLIPGIIDCHFHLLHGALELANIQLGEVKTEADLERTICSFAESHPQKAWLQGFGLLYSVKYENGGTLSRHILDCILPDRPLLIYAYDGHTAWANTNALMKAGILHGGTTGTGSEIVIGDDGSATGELRELGAFEHVSDRIPKPAITEKRRLVLDALALAARHGLTSVHNMDGDYEQITMYAEMESAAEMTLRVYMPFSVRPGMPLKALEEGAAMKTDFHGNMVRGGAAKFFMDGVLESYTALMVEEYATDPGNTGEAQYTLEEFTELAAECDRLGLQIFTHACGNGGVRRTLDGYEALQKIYPPLASAPPRRHRVEHIEVIHPDDLPRFASLGVIASMQPLHSPLDLSVDPDPWPSRAGVHRYEHSFAWRKLRSAGATLVFGSDWPVVSLDPILGFNSALNRKLWAPALPDQRQTLAEILDSYTRQAAYAEYMEDHKGMLRTGMLADMVLLSADLEDQPIEEIRQVHPVMTICDGKIVFEE